MGILKKINKGLILTILVILGIFVYLFSLESYRSSQKPAIKSACEEYMNVINKYMMLPEGYNSTDKKISTEELNKYMSDIKTDISKYLVNNDGVIKVELDSIKSNFENQINNKEIITSYSRKIVNIAEYSFDDDQVTVKINTFYEYKVDNNTKSDDIESTVILKKEEGSWKVVHSDLINAQVIKYASPKGGI